MFSGPNSTFKMARLQCIPSGGGCGSGGGGDGGWTSCATPNSRDSLHKMAATRPAKVPKMLGEKCLCYIQSRGLRYEPLKTFKISS